MNGSHVNTISNRLSLRPPQRESLEILARVCDIIPLEKMPTSGDELGSD
jgi:type III restriction enzyme